MVMAKLGSQKVMVPSSEYSQIVRERSQGATLQTIADRYGVSRERIRQICVRVDPESSQRALQARQELAEKEEAARRTRAFMMACVRALRENKRCVMCGAWVLRGWMWKNVVTCSPECEVARIGGQP